MRQSSFDDNNKPILDVKTPPGYEYDPYFFNRHPNLLIRSNINNTYNTCNTGMPYGSMHIHNVNSPSIAISNSQPTIYLGCDPVRRPNYV